MSKTFRRPEDYDGYKEYKIGKNTVRIYGELKWSERLEKATREFMVEVLRQRKAAAQCAK